MPNLAIICHGTDLERGMGLFLNRCHRLICIVLSLCKHTCKEVCDVSPGIDKSPFPARSCNRWSLQSRRDEENLAANSTRSWRDLSNLGEMEEISPRFRNSQTPWWDLGDRDLGHLGEMENISPRSRRDLESHKHHCEISTISARSRQSWRDGEYLTTISLRFRILQTSWRDLGEISAISARYRQSGQDLTNLSEISVKILHGCYLNCRTIVIVKH